MRKIFSILILFATSLLLSGDPLPAQEKSYDVLIKNAIIFDGVQSKALRGDVAINGDKIVEVGKTNATGFLEINAKGLVLTPGFIDAHTHSDFNPLVYPQLQNKIMQGVTTEVTGNCGMSAAPVFGHLTNQIQGIWAREGVQIPKKLKWQSFADYRQALEQTGLSNNMVGLVGHGNLRAAVMGFSPSSANASQIDQMKKLLSQSMVEGAAGISFGLIYLPGLYAQQEELTELCREAGRRGGICAFHMRSEGSKLLESIEEVIRIARAAQTPVQISHLKAGGRRNWPKIHDAFKLIEAARLEGLQIEADVYPYTGTSAELAIILPDELYRREDRVKLFQDTAKREELLQQLRNHYEAVQMKWDTVMIGATGNAKWQQYEGKTIKAIANENQIEPVRFLIEILAGTGFEVSAFSFSQSEDVVKDILAQPYVVVGSDSVADGSRKPHPRAFGTFPKIFRHYVREQKLLSLGEAIRKITSVPAQHFKLKDRGQIKPGYIADLVLFDAGDIQDTASYERSNALPRGTKWVFVNGKAVVQKGKATGQKAGKNISLS